MRYPLAALAALTILATVLAGCGAQQTGLPHAVYANAVPIYPGATLEDAMGSTTAGDTPESTSDGMAWFFDVQAPADKLLAFYQSKLPNAKRDPQWLEGIRLVWVPEGAAPGEEVSIVIGENELSIREDVRPGKRPGNPNEWSQGVAGELSGAVKESSGGDDR
jgi:hypothetical protein